MLGEGGSIFHHLPPPQFNSMLRRTAEIPTQHSLSSYVIPAQFSVWDFRFWRQQILKNVVCRKRQMIRGKLLLPSSVGRRNTISERSLKVLTHFGKMYRIIFITKIWIRPSQKSETSCYFEQDIPAYVSLRTKSKHCWQPMVSERDTKSPTYK
jgi:hypothetical protein